MQQTGYFTVLRYVPDEYREEFINIGIILHSPNDKVIDIKLTKNFSRVKSFDDEVNLEILKLVLEGLEEDFKVSTVNGPSITELESKELLKNRTTFYVNQLQFSPIYQILINDFERDFNDLFRTYIYFETKKKERITSEEVKTLMRRVMRTKGILDKIDKNPVLYNRTEEIGLDFAFTSNDSKNFIKALSFDYEKKKNTQGINQAKIWAYNFEKLIKKSKAEGQNYKFHTVINMGNISEKEKRIIIDTLQEYSLIHNFDKIDEFVNDITEQLII